MKANLTKLRKSRRYSEEYKRKIVKDFERGTFSVLELSRLHHIHFQTIYTWINKYSAQKGIVEIIEMKQSSTQKLKDLETRIKELERAVGQKQLYIDYLEKMMELAKEDLGVDIKKNFGTPPSSGSEKTGKK
jgi:transposase-like protein